MKSLKTEMTNDTFNEYALSNEEMIYVRGGDEGQYVLTTPPPIRI
jgi:hypothetical protein